MATRTDPILRTKARRARKLLAGGRSITDSYCAAMQAVRPVNPRCLWTSADQKRAGTIYWHYEKSSVPLGFRLV